MSKGAIYFVLGAGAAALAIMFVRNHGDGRAIDKKSMAQKPPAVPPLNLDILKPAHLGEQSDSPPVTQARTCPRRHRSAWRTIDHRAALP